MSRSLSRAMQAFVALVGSDRSKMNIPHWCATFHARPDEVRDAWTDAMTEHSTKPQNTYGEGK